MSRNLHHYFFKPSLPTENKSSIDINDCNSIDDDENNVVPFIPDLNQTLRPNESSDDDDEESIIIDLEANSMPEVVPSFEEVDGCAVKTPRRMVHQVVLRL